jgi:hypothetical protein
MGRPKPLAATDIDPITEEPPTLAHPLMACPTQPPWPARIASRKGPSAAAGKKVRRRSARSKATRGLGAQSEATSIDEDECGRVGCSAKRVDDPGEGLGSEGERQLGAGLGEAEEL